MFTRRLATGILAICLTASAKAEHHVSDMAQAAKNFLASLNDDQRSMVQFQFADEERVGWHFIPKERKGLPLNQMEPEQAQLASALLATSLSPNGHTTALTVMSLEKVLQVMEGENRRFPRDPALYHFSIFGHPGDSRAWGWRCEGHHLSLNFTVINNELVIGTPAFFGSNPAKILSGPRRGLRALAAEEDLGYELARTLTLEQREKGIYADKAPADILTKANRKAHRLEIEGVSYAEMSGDQRELLQELVHVYLSKHRHDVMAHAEHKIIRGGWDNVRFAWAGPIDKEEGNYYMVQGPSFLLEYDNTQNDNNHVHSVWRDFDGDFGEDLLARHHNAEH